MENLPPNELPYGVRIMIYDYLRFGEFVDKILRLSKQETILINKNKTLFRQESHRTLRIYLDRLMNQVTDVIPELYIALATEIEVVVQ